MRCLLLALNYGSSSLKYAVFEEEKELRRRKFNATDIESFKHLLLRIRDELYADGIVPDIIAHRFVHGGDLESPFRISPESLEELRRLVELNPLHNKIAFFCIDFCVSLFPGSEHYAVFDTDFHRTIPPEARIYGVDYDLYASGVKRYGFHGLSYSYVLRRTRELLGVPKPNIIALHLGAGASACAVKDGISVETSMGFSPLEGLMMASRPGDIDVGVIIHMLEKGMSTSQLKEYLYGRAGLKAITGTSDFREIVVRAKRGDKIASLAFDAFVHRITKYVGSYWMILGGSVDAISFSGGIGENSPEVRSAVCGKLRCVGVSIDDEANSRNSEIISAPESKVRVLVIRTNEEFEMMSQVMGFRRRT